MSGKSIIIIGAGVVGAATALVLQQDGHQVTLVDREWPCYGASFGNAGLVVNASCAPTAMPGIVFNVLRMIGRPLSPLTIRPSYVLEVLPWMARFVNESRRARVHANATALHALTQGAVQSWRMLTANTVLHELLRQLGWLKVYESEKSFAATAYARLLMDELRVPYETLDGGDIQALEPELAPIFAHAILQRDSLQISNPAQMIHGMVELFASRGGRFRKFDVQRIAIGDQQIEIHQPSESMAADKIVIAAGAWSGALAAQIGDLVPLDTERGYHLMLPVTNNAMLGRPVMSGDYSFVLSPMETGLRLSGQVEFAGLDAAPDYRRVRRLLPIAARILPGLDTEEQSVWMGCRPSLPDSLPVLGFSSQCNSILYAFGHQHLGMTLGPVSAHIIADLLAGRDPEIDLNPYRVDRF